jgi:murein DD-endopeptidase MepM/ murein hydrolase activator NlpD
MFAKRAAVVLCAALLCAPVHAHAKTVNDLKTRQNKVQAEKNEAKTSLSETAAQKSAAQEELDTLDEQLLAVNEEYDRTLANLSETERRLSNAESELAAAGQKRGEQFEQLKARARFMYENGRLGYFEALFGSATFAEFLNNAQYISQIMERDNNLFNELKETEGEIARAIEEIEQKQAEVTVLKARLEEKKAELERALEGKRAAISALNADETKYRAQIENLEQSSKEIEKLIKEKEAEEARKRAEAAKAAASKTAADAAKFSGKLLWPAPSTTVTTSQYGWRTHPISGKKELHTGLDIGLKYGENIVAAEKGTVISSGYNGGYGYCVVISHGGGLSTLYGHCSKLLVSAGDTVSRGQVIAKCGSTGYSTGPHLHFETRENGGHVSPKNYLNY